MDKVQGLVRFDLGLFSGKEMSCLEKRTVAIEKERFDFGLFSGDSHRTKAKSPVVVHACLVPGYIT